MLFEKNSKLKYKSSSIYRYVTFRDSVIFDRFAHHSILRSLLAITCDRNDSTITYSRLLLRTRRAIYSLGWNIKILVHP